MLKFDNRFIGKKKGYYANTTKRGNRGERRPKKKGE
jgi:hypothetical protein